MAPALLTTPVTAPRLGRISEEAVNSSRIGEVGADDDASRAGLLSQSRLAVLGGRNVAPESEDQVVAGLSQPQRRGGTRCRECHLVIDVNGRSPCGELGRSSRTC